MKKIFFALGEKGIQLTEETIILKTNPNKSIEEHVDARLLVNPAGESWKNPPVIMLIDPSNMGKDSTALAKELTDGMARFAEGVSAYPIQYNGRSNRYGIKWINV